MHFKSEINGCKSQENQRDLTCWWCSVPFLAIIFSLLCPVQSNARFIQPGTTVLHGPRDGLFRVCNSTGETLQLAFIYQHYWKFGEPPTWPAKGWFIFENDQCSNIGVNGFFGVMSVMSENENGEIVPYYNGTTPLEDITVRGGQAEIFATENLCLGEAPFSESRDDFDEYRKCSDDQERVPFSIIFNQEDPHTFTLTLD